ncbi:MAG: hypothetical protein ACOYNL_01905 [Rickettsiales bacterium]
MASKTTASKPRPAPKKKKDKKDKTSKELEVFEDIADDVIESDFVPYSCLFDASTIATKDCELLQTIKITGLGYENATHGDLRTAVRATIRHTIPDPSYAIWLHTLRRKQIALPRGHYPDAFSGKVDESWRATQPTSTTYVNELYISIVRASDPSNIGNLKVFKQSFIRKRDIGIRSKHMDRSLVELTKTVNNMLQMLQPFGARLLTLVERNGIFYSEQLEFLEKLINLEERPMPAPERDLSQVLTSGEITFGFNAMEVRSADGHRRFAAILTLKEYKESTLAGIDKFLAIPCELIVSQCFDYTGGITAQEEYQKQAQYLTYSDDKDLAQWMEIDRLMNTKQGNNLKSYGQQQTTIFLIAPGINQLEANMRMVQRSLNRLGMVVIREDLHFEECYWSQLPGNFSFVSRKRAVDTDHLAGFVNLQAAPMGNAKGSPWGPPVSLFTTVQDAPYYFNFHHKKSANSILLGKPGSGRTTFAHLLLTQARKLPMNLWYLDVHHRSAPFITAMGGKVLTPGTPECQFNPFHLPETQTNREFLALWVSTLIDPTGASLNQSTLSFFQSAVDTILQLPREQRRIAALASILREADALLAAEIQRYAAGGPFGELFDAPADNFAAGKLTSWQIGRWMNNPATRVPLTAYLLHRLTSALDRSPTMLVLDEGFRVLDTPLYSARIAGWYDYLSQNNAGVFLMTENIDEAASYHFTPALRDKSATLFAMADKRPDLGYAMGFGFTPEEVVSLSYIDGNAYHVLQKRTNETVVIRAGLTGFPPTTLQTLSGRTSPGTTLSPAAQLAELMGYNKQAS